MGSGLGVGPGGLWASIRNQAQPIDFEVTACFLLCLVSGIVVALVIPVYVNRPFLADQSITNAFPPPSRPSIARSKAAAMPPSRSWSGCWRWRIARIAQPSRAAAARGPKACSWIAPARSPVSAALVARVRKQVGQGMPVRAQNGQAQPGGPGCSPFSQR